ncbi:MAG: formate--tetrahydrofolate ligase [Rubrivivax sp.]
MADAPAPPTAPSPAPRPSVDSDIAIARRATLARIGTLAQQRLGLDADDLIPYGHHKAKLPLALCERLASRPDGRLVLMTAMSPTPAGEGKTTTTVGLADAFSRLGLRSVVALREPSLGPVFGLKGGAAGGGHAQVVPMEDINLHFTGDFSAVALAHNLLAATVDNHLHHGNALGIDPRRVTWKRVVDMNDRALRHLVLGLGGQAHGVPRESGFDIVVASEVMAVLCLATSLRDLKQRLARIVVAETVDRRPVRVSDLRVQGAMAVLLKDALAPNLVQTLEQTPALVHGGPFANIAHGCNSVLATRTALKLADVVVTEAGFGADLGAEKFIDIKCRAAGLWPDAAVVVASIRALKYQGGLEVAQLGREDLGALQRGLRNLARHVDNVRHVYGLPCVVAVNAFTSDTPAELAALQDFGQAAGVDVVPAHHWARGGAGAVDLAQAVLRVAQRGTPRYVYDSGDTLWRKLEQVATRVYRARAIAAPPAVRAQLERWQADGHGDLGVCIAKTPYSFGGDAAQRGALDDHVLEFREVRLAAGAGFVVALAGNVMTMPGLPKVSAAERIDIDDDGQVVGLS